MSYGVFDQVQVRCPQLGGQVNFGYCRAVQDGLPCSRALVCFELKFPVEEYFRRVLKEETFEKILLAQPPDRVESLFRTVLKAKKKR